MKWSLPVSAGVIGAIGFATGWVFDFGKDISLVTSLICGMTGVFAQNASRELLTRLQALVDSGINKCDTDGGEFLDTSRCARLRVENLSLTALTLGVGSPVLAACYSITTLRFFAASALCTALISFLMAVLLFFANRALRELWESYKIRLDALARKTKAQTEYVSLDAAAISGHPNLKGYKLEQ